MKEKLVIRSDLLRKQSDFNVHRCVVEKALPVSHEDFLQLKNYPMRDNDLIAENVGLMYCDSENNLHCLLIYDKKQGDGLLIESEGYSYARYAQYVPQAKLIYEDFSRSQFQEIKFCCPLKITQYIEESDESEVLDNCQIAEYADEINRGIEKNDLPEEKERGLMHWCSDGELDEKIYSAHCSAEVVNGELTGVVTAKVFGELSDVEMKKFLDYCSGQLSDGWGESLEQHGIMTGIGEVFVSFWNSSEDWCLLSEDEYFGNFDPQSENFEMGGLS